VNEVLNVECGNLVLGVPVLKAVVSGHSPQVVRILADDPRAKSRIVLTLDTAMHVQYRQRLCVGQRRRLDRFDVASLSLEIVL
jgi:hypothetical protein